MRHPEGREVVIVEAVRTPIGRGHREKGYYKDTHPNALLAKCYTEVIERSGIDPSEVEDVIAGCVQQFGEQGFNIARNAWLQAGLPIETPGTTVDRQCGSAQQAVGFAAALIAAGVHDAMIGSGVEHMGHLPFAAGMKTQEDFGYAFTPELMAKHNIVGQGLGAEMIADQWEISRSELDELAVGQHDLRGEHVVRREAVFQAVGPARILRDVPSDRAHALRRRVGRVVGARGAEMLADVEVGHAGLNAQEAVFQVDLEDPLHAREGDHDAARHGQRAAGQARAGPPRDEGEAVFPCELHDGHDLRGRGGKDDESGHDAEAREPVALVGAKVGGIGDAVLRAHERRHPCDDVAGDRDGRRVGDAHSGRDYVPRRDGTLNLLLVGRYFSVPRGEEKIIHPDHRHVVAPDPP